MDNDINREINIEQVEFGIDIDNIEYSIEINPRDTFAIELNEQGPQGARGPVGNGIESYELTSTVDLTDTYTITFTDGNTTTVNVTNGRGITSITGPVSVGNVDTYTINYNDSTTSTFTVTNGIDGVNPTVTVGSTTTGNPGTNASVVNTGTAQDVVLDFTIPRGDKGDTGSAATIAVGTVTTGLPTDPASVTNVGTSGAAIFDFTIPKGDTGDTGATGNGIVSITKTGTVGLVDTYTILYTDGTSTTFTVTNGRDGSSAVTDVTVNGTSVLDGDIAKVIVPTDNLQLTNGAGYITGITSGDVTTALGYTPYNSSNPNGYISGITSGDVTTALGYTPYNSSNPNGYTSNIGTVTSVNGNTPDGTGAVTVSIPTVNDATLTINQGGIQKGTFTANASSNVSINLDGNQRNIGEIVTSTIPLTDAGLHLLDGSLLVYGSYQAFIDYIAGLVSTYPDCFCTEADWQTAVTTYGVCGKFVYDSVNNTVRLPKITGILEGTTDATALGDLVEAGLPNITGGYTNYRSLIDSPFGAFSPTYTTTAPGAAYQSDTPTGYVRFDASKSNSIYGNSPTVQPQTIKCYYYIVIATSAKTEIEVDIDEIATDLNGKADVDLTNVNDSGTSRGAGWAMPSAIYYDFTLGASGTTYTAPANGWFHGQLRLNDASGLLYISNTINTLIQRARTTAANQIAEVCIPVKKGDIVGLTYGTLASNTSSNHLRFFYAVGSESEA